MQLSFVHRLYWVVMVVIVVVVVVVVVVIVVVVYQLCESVGQISHSMLSLSTLQ